MRIEIIITTITSVSRNIEKIEKQGLKRKLPCDKIIVYKIERRKIKMKKNSNKAFTLIELLAVIVILAIIALIATPIVLNIINDTKQSAILRSADFYIDALENEIMLENMNQGGSFNPSICTITKEKVTVDLTVTNHTKIAGKKFMVVVAFYNANGKFIHAVPKQFKTSAERDIKETVVVTDIPEKTASTQVYVWKDFLSLISLID